MIKEIKALIRVHGDYCASHEMGIDVLMIADVITEDDTFITEDYEETTVGEVIDNSDDTVWIVDAIKFNGEVYYQI
jgi:hypothetical protein